MDELIAEGRAGRIGKAAIDAFRAPDGEIDRDALLTVLPYGEEFLFVDAVSHLDEERVEASFTIPEDAGYIRAHFRDLPVMPGALVAEGFAQAGTLLVRYNLEEAGPRIILGMQIDRTRFDSPAAPGETLDYSARLKALDSRAARIEGRVHSAGRRVATVRIVVGVMEVELFRSLGR